MVMLLNEAFNFYMVLCGNNILKQKTVHSCMTYYVHVPLYNAERPAYVLTIRCVSI
jgi:hypothetical protein